MIFIKTSGSDLIINIVRTVNEKLAEMFPSEEKALWSKLAPLEHPITGVESEDWQIK
jgi:hypothetical protein